MTTAIATPRLRTTARTRARLAANSPHSIADIDWSRAEKLGNGSYGEVFRIAPGLVCKVGRSLRKQEAVWQRKFHRLGYALPVLEYRGRMRLPFEATRKICWREHDYPRDARGCECQGAYGVLLMPECVPAIGSADFDDEEIDDFAYEFRDFAREHGYGWDNHRGNVGVYQGKLVALDFGGDWGGHSRGDSDSYYSSSSSYYSDSDEDEEESSEPGSESDYTPDPCSDPT